MLLEPIITSLLETDMYKFSMGQCIYHQFSDYKTTWSFKCRNTDVHFTHEMVEEIKEQIKDAILKGELEDGEILPSIRNFANDIQVSVLTIRRVYEELEKEGFAVSQAGRGTFVSMGNLELLRDSKRRIIEQDLQKAVHNAKLFDIAKDDLYAMLDILYEED